MKSRYSPSIWERPEKMSLFTACLWLRRFESRSSNQAEHHSAVHPTSLPNTACPPKASVTVLCQDTQTKQMYVYEDATKA